MIHNSSHTHQHRHIPTTTQVTLGPRGRNVVLSREGQAPQIVNDGVTIAKEIEVANPEVNIGVRLIQEVAKKSGALVGLG